MHLIRIRQTRRVISPISILRLVKHRVKLIILFLSNRIVLMRVALGTTHRHSHPYLHGCIHSISNRFYTEFLIICATLGISLCVAMKCCGKQLVACGVFQKITGQLLNGKAVV